MQEPEKKLWISKRGTCAFLPAEPPLPNFRMRDIPEGIDPMKKYLFVPDDITDPWGEGTLEELPLPVPASVTPRQIRLALIDRGIMPGQITTMLTAIENETLREKSLAEWEFASAVRRDHPLITQLGGALQFTSDDVDDLFREANTIGG